MAIRVTENSSHWLDFFRVEIRKFEEEDIFVEKIQVSPAIKQEIITELGLAPYEEVKVYGCEVNSATHMIKNGNSIIRLFSEPSFGKFKEVQVKRN